MRISRDEWGLRLAEVTASRGTCQRRQVGCVLVNARGHILATGYNGRAAGQSHCNEGNPCVGAFAPSGQDLDACEAIHSECNALLQCPDVMDIYTCYVTVTPCVSCVKLLLNTGCVRIVARERYAHDEAAQKLWRKDWLILPSRNDDPF